MSTGTLDPEDGPGTGKGTPSRMALGHYGLRLSYIAAVMVGGGAGALSRYGVEQALHVPSGWPVATLAVNLTGAWALGVLLEALHRGGPDTGTRRIVRLVAGTGFLGAFTTYSTLALDMTRLMALGNGAGVAVYLAASLFGGTLASWSGIWCGAAFHQRALQRRSVTEAPNPARRPDFDEEEL